MKTWTCVIFCGSMTGCTLVVGVDDRVVQDGGNDAAAASDSGDAQIAQCTVPAGHDGGCCGQSATPCIGQACAHCGDCLQQSCNSDELCCVQGDPKKPYDGVSCENDLNKCP